MQHSFLFVPGDRSERFDKATASGAHAVILDLEDAVLPENKAAARHAVWDWLASGNRAALRINASGTEWHEQDLTLLGRPGLVALFLPKAEQPEDIARIAGAWPKIQIIALIESALGVWNALEIANAPNVTRLAFGAIDFCLDTGIPESDDGLAYARSRLVLASSVARLPPPIDGVTTVLDQPEVLAADIVKSRRFGFGGKLCIHPRQIGAVNLGYAPTAEQMDWARRVVAAAEQALVGAIRLDGKMIDRPLVEMARRVLGA